MDEKRKLAITIAQEHRRQLDANLYPIIIGWVAWFAYTYDAFKYIDVNHIYIKAVYFTLSCFSTLMIAALVCLVRSSLYKVGGTVEQTIERNEQRRRLHLWAKWCMLMALFPFLLAIITMFVNQMDLSHPAHPIKMEITSD